MPAAMFVANVYGVSLSLETQLTLVILTVLAVASTEKDMIRRDILYGRRELSADEITYRGRAQVES